MRKLTPTSVAAWLLAAWLLFGGAGVSPFVDPPPFKVDRLTVVVVEETSERGTYTPGQREVIESAGGLREYVANKKGELRFVDQNVDVTKSEPWLIEAMKQPRPSLPWLLAATPSAGVNQPLPPTAAEALSAVKKIGGE